MKGKLRIHYDEEGDYLDMFVGEPRPNYGEELTEGITIFRDENTNEVVGVGIINFKKQSQNLKNIELPFDVDFSAAATVS